MRLLSTNIGTKALTFSIMLVWILLIPTIGGAQVALTKVEWFPKDVQDTLPQRVKAEAGADLPTREETQEEDPAPKVEDPLETEDPATHGEAIPPAKFEGIEGPRPPVGADFETPDWMKSFLDWLDTLEFPTWTEAAVRTLFWIVVGIILVFSLTAIIRAFVHSRRLDNSGPLENDLLSVLAGRTKNQSADAHAKQDDYVLAIHALLLHALRELSAHHAIVLAPSATGREIALKIEGGTDGPLYQLVLASEACVFAQSSVSEETFLEAKAWHAAVLQGNA